MPLGEFKDMDDCISKTMASKNMDKERAASYCAVIHKKITGEYPSQKKENSEELAQVTAMEEKRKSLNMTEEEFYAFPRMKKLPIFDEVHARNAMARFNQTEGMNEEEKVHAKSKIMAAAKKFGIETGNFERLEKVSDFEAIRKEKGMSVEEFYAIPRAPPSDSKLPIFDEAHVRNAMARFSQIEGASDEEKSKAKNKIIAKAKHFGIEIGDFSKLSKDSEPPKSKRFSIAMHQLGPEKHIDIRLEKEGYIDSWWLLS